MRIVPGSERLLESGLLAGRRVGVVCNPASIDGEFRHVADRLAADARVRLAALFGPQHGFRSDVQENMIETGHGRDEIRRVPVYSLYSDTREPTAEMLRDLDVLNSGEYVRDRELGKRLRLLERLRVLEALPFLESPLPPATPAGSSQKEVK